MASDGKNSFDFLRLIAAAAVLYSHQYALVGLDEPSFFGWNSFGGAGVTIFFFLSGMLVWSSWAHDSNFRRFFQRRSLRIFPALWVVVVITILVLGPVLTTQTWGAYFASRTTWSYLTTAILLPRNVLPGVFEANPYPLVINGSLWTLPVEFFCYVTVAVVGSIWQRHQWFWIGMALVLTVLVATYAPLLAGKRFTPHFEMISIFWSGVLYGYCTNLSRNQLAHRIIIYFMVCAAFLMFVLLGPRGPERAAMLLFAMMLVFLSQITDIGARLTDRLGDLSYGIYIYAFPVQQIVIQQLGPAGRSFPELLLLSSLITLTLAYLSWHLVERWALRYKPIAKNAL